MRSLQNLIRVGDITVKRHQVCARWFKFENFWLIWATASRKTLDRRNSEGHYMPSNCSGRRKKATVENKKQQLLPALAGNLLSDRGVGGTNGSGL